MGDNSVGVCAVLVVNIALFCCCAHQPGEKGVAPIARSQQEEKELDASIAEIKQRYEAAQSQYERRAVTLRAIDEGKIERGRPVSLIDAIFRTNFVSDLPPGVDSKGVGEVYFGPNFSPGPRADGAIVAGGHIGWSMKIEYDYEGQILSYYLSNIWKGHSSYEESKDRLTIDELKRLYEIAPSEQERRAVCLRAIDEGALATFQPVSRVDELFGTRLFSDLPSRKENQRLAKIELVPPRSSPNPGAGSRAWFLAVEYRYDGQIRNYYLTNVNE